MLDDGAPSATTEEQAELEARVAEIYSAFVGGSVADDDPLLELRREAHVCFLHGGLGALPAGFASLDASRTWVCYWILHALALLEAPPPPAPARADLVAFLAACQHPTGGFGGGPHQLPHLATTYAAVAALVTLGGAHALAAIDRPALRRFLLEMCVPPAAGGGMRMHAGGEVDVRGCYCALAAARMVSLDTGEIADACALGAFVARCQSHEGGLGGEPGNEAHGGYAFCGLAALALAERAGAVDARAALRWASRMQGSFEGGFMGRTAKLVDGCYSLWQGGAFALLARALAGEGGGAAVRPRVPADAELEAHAERVAAGLLGAEGDAEAAFVEALRPEAPEAAAVRLLAAAEGRLEAAVAAALAADEAAAAAAGAPEAGARRAAALAALEAAAEARAAVERAAAHERAARCAAPVLLREYRPGGADAAEEGPSASGGASAPLYDAAAQQLWVLAACQAPRGGLRDKPGKPPDYYHSCYCLSGLAAAQRDAGGAPLGGRANALAEPDPLCNVVAARLAEARAFFAAADE